MVLKHFPVVYIYEQVIHAENKPLDCKQLVK